ncbi:hypothetical protein ACTWP6_17725 [Mycobacterium sp. 4D054]|uniref:hypothetical protein n=1 Tax=Mycobacterium sp. 4D054 TaxID=3457440 RepID=UPI003FD17C31
MSNPTSDDDLRRAVRLVVAIRESDMQVQKMVAGEVERLGRWRELALASAIVARTVLLQIDEEPRDEGALTMWLHAAIEQLIDGGAWWLDDDDTD